MNDYGDKKGFHILDTETRQLEFVKNPHTIFTQIRYDDSEANETIPLSVEEERTRGKFVRIIVDKKTKPYLFEKFVDSVYASAPHGVTIIEDLQPDQNGDSEEVDLGEDTITIINREIEALQNLSDPKRLKTLVRDLYTECLANETANP
jgi:hypothetical protein